MAFLSRKFLDVGFPVIRLSRISRGVIALFFLLWFLRAVFPDIDRSRRVHYHERTAPWRSFANQLYSKYPTMSGEASLAFLSPPFDPATHDRWCLHFLVRLKYRDRSLKVYRLPEEKEGFIRSLPTAVEAHLFEWRNGDLLERKISDLAPGNSNGI
jgi:hypothetical protein